MNLQFCSDLHLEFRENKQLLGRHPLQAVGDVLILAGDIVPFADKHKHEDFFDYVSAQFSKTYWIPGNHEYYHSDIADRSGSFTEDIRDNVQLLNNVSVDHEGVKLIFSTLWSRISPGNEWQIERSINDFHAINHQKGFFSAAEFNRLHTESLAFLTEELTGSGSAKTVVVSHHVPTFLNYPPEYQGSFINEAFTTELFPLIASSDADYWIYGHHHRNIPDFRIGNTMLVTNQLGYVVNKEHQAFKNNRVISL